ncbi:MAG: hypothetical protein ABR502_12335 [Chitinophagaceae bacterium]
MLIINNSATNAYVWLYSSHTIYKENIKAQSPTATPWYATIANKD